MCVDALIPDLLIWGAVYLRVPDRHGERAHSDPPPTPDPGGPPQSERQRHTEAVLHHTALPQHLQRETL